MPDGKHGSASHVANAAGRSGVGGGVIDVVTELSHQGIEDGSLVSRKQIHSRSVRCKADCLVLVRERVFLCGTTQLPAELRADSMLIVGSPGVVSAGMHDRECAGHHGRTERTVAHALQHRLVPLNDNGWALSVA